MQTGTARQIRQCDDQEMVQSSGDRPESALVSFFSAMNQWEIWCEERDRTPAATQEDHQRNFAESLSELKRIFHKHTALSSAPPRGVRFRKPPEYDPALEKIVKVHIRGNVAEIETRQHSGFKLSLLYRLELSEGAWRLVGRWWLDEGKKKKVEL